MATNEELEKRIETLEKEVQHLKAFKCCTSFSKVSILFSSSSLVAIFFRDKFLDIYTIKKATFYSW